MRNRRILEFAICLVLAALIMRFSQEPATKAEGPLSVCGIRPGMTRSQVVQILGHPARDGPLYADYKNELKSISGRFDYDSPYIIYNKEGQVVRVVGPRVEWQGGSLQQGASLKSARAHFPDLTVIQQATTGRFRPHGIVDIPQHQLRLLTDMKDSTGLTDGDGWFGREVIDGVELGSHAPELYPADLPPAFFFDSSGSTQDALK